MSAMEPQKSEPIKTTPIKEGKEKSPLQTKTSP
jgi:hypothetical protein